MLIAEGLRAIASLMGNRAAAIPSGDRLLGGMARLGITTPRLETLLATLVDPDPVEKLANQAASAAQALEEARSWPRKHNRTAPLQKLCGVRETESKPSSKPRMPPTPRDPLSLIAAPM